jgi:hypothetical protein
VRLRRRTHTSLAEVGRTLFRTYRQRTLVGITLMAAQAFFYNAIFFTYARNGVCATQDSKCLAPQLFLIQRNAHHERYRVCAGHHG